MFYLPGTHFVAHLPLMPFAIACTKDSVAPMKNILTEVCLFSRHENEFIPECFTLLTWHDAVFIMHLLPIEFVHLYSHYSISLHCVEKYFIYSSSVFWRKPLTSLSLTLVFSSFIIVLNKDRIINHTEGSFFRFHG